MKLAVEFPSVVYREGGDAVWKLGQAIEQIGFDEIDMFDHVVMGYPTDTRDAPRYPPKMPIMEALMMLSFIASATKRVGLGTEVLVLPQRQPTLVAKQISTLDTLSGGRVRLGIGVGWQQAEFEALGESFANRGRRTDEAIRLLRAYFADERVDFKGKYYTADAIAMEPKPPQGARLPIWIGGASPAAYERIGRYGDGWLATAYTRQERAAEARRAIEAAAAAAGRDPKQIGTQTMFDVPPTDAKGKAFYADKEAVVRRAHQIVEQGFDWAAINATALFQSGARTVNAMIDALGDLHGRIRKETG
jgi:probable F420-dependent oxidoreductase